MFSGSASDPLPKSLITVPFTVRDILDEEIARTLA
jgi:hypothetical protein